MKVWKKEWPQEGHKAPKLFHHSFFFHFYKINVYQKYQPCTAIVKLFEDFDSFVIWYMCCVHKNELEEVQSKFLRSLPSPSHYY